VGLGHRDQLGGVEAVSGGLADQGDGVVLVAVAGRRSHGEAQPVAGRGWPRWLVRRHGRPQAVAIGVGRWLDGQMPAEAAQGLLAGL